MECGTNDDDQINAMLSASDRLTEVLENLSPHLLNNKLVRGRLKGFAKYLPKPTRTQKIPQRISGDWTRTYDEACKSHQLSQPQQQLLLRACMAIATTGWDRLECTPFVRPSPGGTTPITSISTSYRHSETKIGLRLLSILLSHDIWQATLSPSQTTVKSAQQKAARDMQRREAHARHVDYAGRFYLELFDIHNIGLGVLLMFDDIHVDFGSTLPAHAAALADCCKAMPDFDSRVSFLTPNVFKGLMSRVNDYPHLTIGGDSRLGRVLQKCASACQLELTAIGRRPDHPRHEQSVSPTSTPDSGVTGRIQPLERSLDRHPDVITDVVRSVSPHGSTSESVFLPSVHSPESENDVLTGSEYTQSRALDIRSIKQRWPSLSKGMGDIDNMLLEYYFTNICPGRTPLSDNAYLREFPQILQAQGASCSSILALAASYLKERPGYEWVEQAELIHHGQCLQELGNDLSKGHIGPRTAVVEALVLHYVTLNPSPGGSPWTNYLSPFPYRDGIHLDSRIAVASVTILALTAVPCTELARTRERDFSWIAECPQFEATRINSTLGLSRKTLYDIHRVTVQPLGTVGISHDLVARFEVLDAWVRNSEDAEARCVAISTAKTYQLGGKVYCYSRLLSYTPWHSEVRQTCLSLADALIGLPQEGPMYTSIHPAWCFVLACACASEEAQYLNMVAILARITESTKSNVNVCMELVERMKQWQRRRWVTVKPTVDDGWWEEMLRDVYSGQAICLA